MTVESGATPRAPRSMKKSQVRATSHRTASLALGPRTPRQSPCPDILARTQTTRCPGSATQQTPGGLTSLSQPSAKLPEDPAWARHPRHRLSGTPQQPQPPWPQAYGMTPGPQCLAWADSADVGRK
ncbi:hypothetical protein CapIbe_021067 [Capra ibex]